MDRTCRPITIAVVIACVACDSQSESYDYSSGGGGATSSSGTGGGNTSASGTGAGTGDPLGQVYDGGEYHLGPVDYAETEWHNACAPGGGYIPEVQQVEGVMLAGLWNGIPNVSGYCDACVAITTDLGNEALLRVVTYGDTSTNSIDVSPEAFAVLDSGEYPRLMSWQFAKCPDSGPVLYEFQTGSNEWWTSLWVRNARVPLARVEVQSENHGDYVELTRGGDGTLTDGGGFGAGSFSIRLTGVDDQQLIHDFEWPGDGIAGALLTGADNFN